MEGKTTTMLKAAFAAAMDGQTVLVVGADRARCQELMNAMIYLPECKAISFAVAHNQNQEISVWPKGQVLFRPMTNGDWDASAQRFKGYPYGTQHFSETSATKGSK